MIKTVPLGFAVMSVRGATTDLTDALARPGGSTIVEARTKLVEAVNSYLTAKTATPKDSIVTLTWTTLGEASMLKAREALRISVDASRAKLSLV